MSSKIKDAVEFFQPKLKGWKSRQFYCYVYEIDGVPVYVGIGKDDRYLGHLADALRPGKAVSGIAGRLKVYKKEMNGSLTIRFSLHSNKRENVIERERKLIARFGRRKEGGTLMNSTSGGDGGSTTKGKFYINNGTTQKVADRVPNGWAKGSLRTFEGYKWLHNPTTGKEIRLKKGSRIPNGFVVGKKKGLGTGPTGTKIWHHPMTGHRVWLHPEETPPKGYRKGRGGEVYMTGRIACYNKTTGRMTFIAAGEKVPKGFVKGGRPAPNGKECSYKGKTYSSVQACQDATGLTRYALYKDPKFKKWPFEDH